MVNLVTIFPKRQNQFFQQPDGILKRLQFRNLAADMHIDTGNLNSGQAGGMGIDGPRPLPGNAELVFLFAC